MDLLKILTVILFIIVTVVTLKIHPDMHQPMIIENENFKLTRISDTLVTKNIPVSRPAEPETSQKTIEVQEQKPVTQTKYVQPESNKIKSIKKEVTTPAQPDETSQLEILQKMIQKEKEQHLEEPVELPKPSAPKEQAPHQVEPAKQDTGFYNPYMTQQEEIIAWNKWRSNLQNQIMKDSQIDYAPLGTMFLFTFIVDKYGNIANIKVECSNPNYMNIARDRVKPAIANLQKKPILNFPKGTQRTSTVVTGIFLIGTQERYSTPEDFSDFERVVY